MRVQCADKETESATNNRLLRYRAVNQAIHLGLTTADNIDRDERHAVQDMLRHWPVWDDVDESTNTVYMTDTRQMIEGRDWCFATTGHGYFGVFSLDEPMMVYLAGATFHFWPEDYFDKRWEENSGGTRVDYTDLGEYLKQTASYVLITEEPRYDGRNSS